MAAWKYYTAERALHSRATFTMVPVADLAELYQFLSDAATFHSFRVGYHANIGAIHIKTVKVSVNTRQRGWSYYCHASPSSEAQVKLAPGRNNLLTVVHEWAHHAARMLWLAHCRMQTQAGKASENYRAHNKHHKEIVDWAVPLANAWLLTRSTTCLDAIAQVSPTAFAGLRAAEPAQVPAPAPVIAPEPAQDLKAAFFATLPETLTCPCCKATLPKSNFGVRTMSKTPLRFARQSYCSICRATKKPN